MSVSLDWINEQSQIDIQELWINKLEILLQIAAKLEEVDTGNVSLSFVDDERIHQLNKEYRGIDRPTDVLSFAMRDSMDEEDTFVGNQDPSYDEMLGDIVISMPTAKAQSEEYGHSLEREISFLFVHGFLHLVGYDHQDEDSELRMFAKQEMILEEAGIVR